MIENEFEIVETCEIPEEILKEQPKGMNIPLAGFKENKKASYRYDLESLEKAVDSSYHAFKKKDNENTRTELFKTIFELSIAILKVGKVGGKLVVTPDEAAYEYSLGLLERLITGAFVPTIKTKMPWQQYINLGLRHYVNPKTKDESWLELVEDLELLINGNAAVYGEQQDLEEEQNKEISKQHLSSQLMKALELFYEPDYIRKMLPISIDLLFSNEQDLINSKMPKDIKDFSIVLVCLAKRLASESRVSELSKVSKSQLNKMFSSSLRSTVFLASVVNSNFFPRELLLSLDIDSLYRLVQVAGGKKIRVPTQRELDTLIGSVVAVSKMIMEGKEFNKSIRESKKDFDLVFSYQVNIETFCSKIIQSIDLFSDPSQSSPLVSMVLMTIRSLDRLFTELTAKIDKTDPETLIKSYEAMSQTMDKMTHILAKLQEQVEKSKEPKST